MKAVAEALRVSRSNLSERMKGKSKPRGPYLKHSRIADTGQVTVAVNLLQMAIERRLPLG